MLPKLLLSFAALVSIAAGGVRGGPLTPPYVYPARWGSSFVADVFTADLRVHGAAHEVTSPHVRATRASAAAVYSPAADGVWECIKRRESGGNYADKDSASHRGAFQFSYSTWRSVGGSGDPADASPAEQDQRARDLQRRSGWGQWSTHGACGV